MTAEEPQGGQSTEHACERAEHAGTRWQMDLPQLSGAGGGGDESTERWMKELHRLEMEERSESWMMKDNIKINEI